MTSSILDFFEDTVTKHFQKIAYQDNECSFSFDELKTTSKKIATAIAERFSPRNPVVVYMSKGCHSIAAFLGICWLFLCSHR